MEIKGEVSARGEREVSFRREGSRRRRRRKRKRKRKRKREEEEEKGKKRGLEEE